jgi:UPF0716 family protein affecting phage T7 exclusion
MALQDHFEELEPSGLIIIGAILVLIPEPATSTLGAGLVLLGLAWWFWQWR